MKIRICSDLHIDYNKSSDFKFVKSLNEVDLNIIAGDIAGSCLSEEKFLKDINQRAKVPVICIGGNHLGYQYISEFNKNAPEVGTKEYSITRLTNTFSSGPVFYLENEFVDIGDYIIYAGTMYSDFLLYGNQSESGNIAMCYMNDFRYVYTGKNLSSIRPVTYLDYIHWFNLFLNGVKNCLQETTKPVIVVSHFAPSLKSISKKYNGKYKELNPAYASNLDSFIEENPRIKLWVHGHMHDSFDYYIGDCRVVCVPFGYSFESNISLTEYDGMILNI